MASACSCIILLLVLKGNGEANMGTVIGVYMGFYGVLRDLLPHSPLSANKLFKTSRIPSQDAGFRVFRVLGLGVQGSTQVKRFRSGLQITGGQFTGG